MWKLRRSYRSSGRRADDEVKWREYLFVFLQLQAEKEEELKLIRSLGFRCFGATILHI